MSSHEKQVVCWQFEVYELMCVSVTPLAEYRLTYATNLSYITLALKNNTGLEKKDCALLEHETVLGHSVGSAEVSSQRRKAWEKEFREACIDERRLLPSLQIHLRCGGKQRRAVAEDEQTLTFHGSDVWWMSLGFLCRIGGRSRASVDSTQKKSIIDGQATSFHNVILL